MTAVSRTEPGMYWNDIIDHYYERVIVRRQDAATPSRSVQTEDPDDERKTIRELAASAAGRYRGYDTSRSPSGSPMPSSMI